MSSLGAQSKEGTPPRPAEYVGLRTALKILEKAQASKEQVCSLLRISAQTYENVRKDAAPKPIRPDEYLLDRLSLVLNIHAALRATFENPENVYSFVTASNHNDFS